MDLLKKFVRGGAVVVCCAEGKTRENAVWEDFGDVVGVCAPADLDGLLKGAKVVLPICFKRKDVQAVTN